MTYIRPFKNENYLNPTSNKKDEHIYLSADSKHIIIEKEIFINNRTSTNRYDACGKSIITKTENAHSLIKAVAQAWRYKKMYEKGVSIDEIRKREQKGVRTIYKYLGLSYLSPNIVSDILDSKIPSNTNLQSLFKISSYPDFCVQEKYFYHS